MLGEWRSPITYPLASLLRDLQNAIATAKRHTPVNSGARVYAWTRTIEKLQRQDRRAVALEMAATIKKNLEVARRQSAAAATVAEDRTSDVWTFPLRDAFRSLLEARMFVQIVGRLETKLRPADWRTIVRGSLRPEDDKVDTPHRDHLLELWVASTAEAGGLNVQLDEPDVVVSLNGERVGIAVKRVKSTRQVLANASRAAQQIKNSGVSRGMIFLDVGDLVNRKTVAMRYLQDLGGRISGSVQGNLLKLVSEHSQLYRLLEQPHVEGIVLRLSVPAMFSRSFIPATMETWSPMIEQPSETTVAIYGCMLDGLTRANGDAARGLPSGTVPCEFAYAHP